MDLMLAQSSTICETQQRGLKATDLLKNTIGRRETGPSTQMCLTPINTQPTDIRIVDRIIYKADCRNHLNIPQYGHIVIFKDICGNHFEKHTWVESRKWQHVWFAVTPETGNCPEK